MDIDFLGLKPHGLHKELVAELVRKADDLGLKGGTVPGPDALDDAGVHGGPIQIFQHDALCLLRGPGEVAHGLVLRCFPGGVGEGHRQPVTLLELHHVKVHAAGVDPGRRSGFEPPQRQSQVVQGVRQTEAGVHAVGAGVLHAFAHDGAAGEVGAGGQNHGPDGKDRPGGEHHGADCAVFRADLHHFPLADGEMLLAFQGVFHIGLVFPPVRLGPEAPNGGAFALVQKAVLDAAGVGGLCHLAAQSVQLPHQVALAGATDSGVAGHVAHGIQVDGKDDGLHPQPGGGQRRLNACVSGADDGDIKLSGVECFHGKPRLSSVERGRFSPVPASPWPPPAG